MKVLEIAKIFFRDQDLMLKIKANTKAKNYTDLYKQVVPLLRKIDTVVSDAAEKLAVGMRNEMRKLRAACVRFYDYL